MKRFSRCHLVATRGKWGVSTGGGHICVLVEKGEAVFLESGRKCLTGAHADAGKSPSQEAAEAQSSLEKRRLRNAYDAERSADAYQSTWHELATLSKK